MKKKSWKTLIVSLLIIIMSVGMFAGCDTNEPAADNGASTAPDETGTGESGEKVVIEFAMMNSSSEIDGWTAMVNAANEILAEDNIEISITLINATDWSEYYQKIASRTASGNAPDIGRVAESYMPTLISKNQVVDLTGYMADNLDMSQYYEKTFENSAYVDGKYYGLPSGTYYYVMYYNKDLFDQYDVAYPSSNWADPSTFDEITEMAKAMSVDTDNGRQYGFYTGPYMAEVGMFSVSLGGNNVFDAAGTPTMNSAESKTIYNWFDNMLRVDRSMPTPTDTAIMSSFDLFLAGRLGMLIDGTWYLGAIKGIEDFNVGIAAVPAGEGSPAYTSQFVDSFVMFEGSKHKDEAWKALQALISQEGFSALAATGVGGTPIHKEVVNAVMDETLGTCVDNDSKLCAMDGMNFTIKVPYNSYYQQADDKVNSVMDEWMLGQITADDFAEEVQQILIDYAARAEQ